jgi:hypothetical protein
MGCTFDEDRICRHVFRRDCPRRSTWYAKYRLPDGRQVQKRIGPAWTERGRPAAGDYTKRTAEAWLRAVLDEAQRGTLPGLVQTGATFADDRALQRAGLRPLRFHDLRHTFGGARRRPDDHEGSALRAAARRRRPGCRRIPARGRAEDPARTGRRSVTRVASRRQGLLGGYLGRLHRGRAERLPACAAADDMPAEVQVPL